MREESQSITYVACFCSLIVCKHKSCVCNQTCFSKQKQISYKPNRPGDIMLVFSRWSITVNKPKMIQCYISSSGSCRFDRVWNYLSWYYIWWVWTYNGNIFFLIQTYNGNITTEDMFWKHYFKALILRLLFDHMFDYICAHVLAYFCNIEKILRININCCLKGVIWIILVTCYCTYFEDI